MILNAYERMIAKFINGLADSTLWAKGIAGYICGVEGEAGAFVNIFDPTGTLASKSGSVTHNSPLGWKSGGGFINTNINSITSGWAENSGCMAIVTMDTDLEPAVYGAQMGDRYYTNTLAKMDEWSRARLNTETNVFPTNTDDVMGIMIVNRVGAGEVRVINGVNVAETIANASTSLWDDNPDNWFYICGASAETAPTAVGAALWFEGLTPTEETTLQGLLLELFDDLTDLI